MKIIEIWWNKANRYFGISFHKQHWKILSAKTNGWRKGIDPCYDLNIHFLGIFISYTRFNCKIDYDKIKSTQDALNLVDSINLSELKKNRKKIK